MISNANRKSQNAFPKLVILKNEKYTGFTQETYTLVKEISSRVQTN